jgi:hypothetical protein
MSRTISYLNPTKYYSNPRLDDVLLLVPSYVQPAMRTQSCIELACAAGANVVSSFGCSDPALHRCLVAGRALYQMGQCPGRWQYVCWIDDDMVFGTAHIAMLRDVSRFIASATTGIYCRRGQPTVVCVRDIPPQEIPVEVNHVSLPLGDDPAWVEFQSYPVTAGMGCLMVPAGQFEQHCLSVPSVKRNVDDGSVLLTPGICSSGIAQDDEGSWGWQSEDESYCEGLWVFAKGLWTVPIAFGHMSNVPLIPAPDATWLHADNSTPLRVPPMPIAP